MDLVRLANPTAAKHPKILLVEDDPQWQLLMTTTLRSLHEGAHVECVSSQREADQALLGGRHFDYVLADVMLMGEGTGIDLWRKHQDLAGTSFLLMTGLHRTEFLDFFSEDEVAPVYLPKSAGLKNLHQMLKEAMRDRPHLRPTQWAALLTGLTLMGSAALIQNGWIKPPRFAKERVIARVPSSLHVAPALNPAIPGSPVGAVHEIVTPELKARFARILKNADEAQAVIIGKLRPRENGPTESQ